MASTHSKHTIIKKSIGIVFLFLLWLPLIQSTLDIPKIRSLQGYFILKKNPKFSIQSWFDGIYQTQKQDFIEENIGYRSFFVKIYNQIDYSLFDVTHANSVIMGKEGYLYELNYIKAHLGRDFIGHDSISKKTDKLKAIVDTLQTMNISLVVMLAPGKGAYYEEYIPDEFDPKVKTTTNYEVYRENMLRKNIPYMDMQAWFLSMKDTSTYPLYPKTGIHWSSYGEILVADSLVKYIENTRKTKLPKLIIDKIETSRTARDRDNDIEKGLNLLFGLKNKTMAYPIFHVSTDSTTTKLKVLAVSDSFYWGIESKGLSNQLYEGSFWYYNEEIYPQSYDSSIRVSDIDAKSEIEKKDVIVLISTDANLYKFAFGFIDQVYELYFGK